MAEKRPLILVLRGGAIGDFVLTLPALAALRARFPRAQLAVMGYPHIAGLALAGGVVHEVHPIEARPMAAFFNPESVPPPDLAARFARAAVIVSYLHDPDRVFEECVRRCTRATFIAGPHRPDESQAVHATEVFLKPLERLAIFGADLVPRLQVPPTAGGRSGARPLLALHPGSGSERKNWPEANWAAVLQSLASQQNLELLLVGGEAEGDRLQRLARAWPADRLQLATSLPLPELAGRLAACHGFAGHDSGITHLAAALGLPGVVLWGETNEAIWRPRSDRMRLLRGGQGLAGLSVSRVVEAIVAMVPPTMDRELARGDGR
jgi:heptosyltransferase-3